MELRDTLKLYSRERRLILGLVFIATIGAYLVAAFRPVTYEVSQAFAVNRVNKEATVDYQFDGYYALQAADLFSETVVSWFTTPAVLRDVYREAQLDPEMPNLSNLPSRFKAKRYSAQNIVIRVRERNEDRATKVAEATRRLMEDKASMLNQTADNKSIFAIVGTDPIIVPHRPQPWVAAAAALVVSAAAACFLVSTRAYLKG